MNIDHIKLSQQAKDQLIKLKRLTGIQNWNVLCRWAFCMSLTDKSVPPQVRIQTDSSVEMTWKTFGGAHQQTYLALIKERCHQDGFAVTDEVLAAQFRLHLHRGIGMLSANRGIRSISDLVALAIPREDRP